MAAAEEGTEPLRYQTLALKVRIHCEGCKKKVKKVLHSIEGVYKTDIDSQQQKVVVIGNVSADALVKKLLKTGKHAEPWPEPAPPPAADGAPGGNPAGGGGGGGGGKKKKKKNKSKNPASNNEPAAADGGGGDGEEPNGVHDKPEGGGGGEPGAGDAHDGSKGAPVAMTPHGPHPNGNGGGGGKKKGKKGGNGHGNANANNANGDGGATGAIVEVHTPDAPPTNQPAAGNAGPVTVVDAGAGPYLPPPMSYPGYYDHPPAYVMSYSTAHPSPALRSAAYYHPMVGGGGGATSGYFYSTAPVAAGPGSYYMFSEENANACSVM